MDYPRVCGGTKSANRLWHHYRGLSPRVRGNLWDGLETARNRRTIPACAGEPRAHPQPERLRKDYPRVCGGTTRRGQSQVPEGGLSPRVRGNPDHQLVDGVDARTIPACAGEPTLELSAGHAAMDYPRVCGGTSPCYFGPRLDCGLSPRVRGNHTGDLWRIES